MILIGSFFFGVLVGSIFKDYITDKLFGLSYNCIYYYSQLQIALRQLNETFMIENTPPEYEGKQICEFVKDGKGHFDIVENYDFFMRCLVRDGILHKKIIYRSDDWTDDLLNTFEESDIRFLLVEFKIGDNEWQKIDLKKGDINYYIVGNKLNKMFFMYYITTHYARDFVDEKCTLKIIDHDVNEFTIDFTDKNENIRLEKNSYKLEIVNH